MADRLTRVVVRAEHEPASLLPKIKLRTQIMLCLSSLALALLYSSLSVPVWKYFFEGSKQPLKDIQTTWVVEDPQGIATLWMILPMGMKEPMYGIRNIELWKKDPNPFTFQAKNSRFITRLNPEPYFEQAYKSPMPVVRIILARERPLQIKLLLVQNFLTFLSQQTPMKSRPAFTLLQIATEKDFGLFHIDQDENILFCFMTSGKDAMDFYTDVRPHGSVNFQLSFDTTAFILVGAGIPYRY